MRRYRRSAEMARVAEETFEQDAEELPGPTSTTPHPVPPRRALMTPRLGELLPRQIAYGKLAAMTKAAERLRAGIR